MVKYWHYWISIGHPESVLALLNLYWPSWNALIEISNVPCTALHCKQPIWNRMNRPWDHKKFRQQAPLICEPIEPFAEKFRQELLSGCTLLKLMWCPTILSPIKTVSVGVPNSLQVSYIVQDAACSDSMPGSHQNFLRSFWAYYILLQGSYNKYKKRSSHNLASEVAKVFL